MKRRYHRLHYLLIEQRASAMDVSLKVRGVTLSVLECANSIVCDILELVTKRRALADSSSLTANPSNKRSDFKRPITRNRRFAGYNTNSMLDNLY